MAEWKKTKKLIRGTAAAGLSLALLMSLIPGTDFKEYVMASGTENDVNLGTSVLDSGQSDQVYFGKYAGGALCWNLLSKENGKAVMLSDTGILNGGTQMNAKWDSDLQINAEDEQTVLNMWKGSDIETWLNGDDFYKNTDNFSLTERLQIVQASNLDTKADGSVASYCKTSDFFYLPSAEDMVNSDYGFSATNGTLAARALSTHQAYWLRSPGSNADLVKSVTADGSISESVASASQAVVPMYQLELSDILLTTKAGQIKPDGLSIPSVYTVDANDKHTWKLTLIDNTQNVSVSAMDMTIDGNAVTSSSRFAAGQTLTIPYTYTGTGANSLTAMITQSSYRGGTLKEYGVISRSVSQNGTAQIVLPADFDPDTDHIYLMAETANGGNLTDYSSDPVEITMPGQTAKPVSDPIGATYTSAKNVSLSSASTDAVIYYTTGSSASQTSDPTTASTVYEKAISLPGVSGAKTNYTIKAIAVKDGMYASDVATFNYTIDLTTSSDNNNNNNGSGTDSTTKDTKYNVIVQATTNGTVSVNPVTAKEGETITVTTTPNTGYELSAISVSTDAGANTISGNTFTMPAQDVIVTAAFAKSAQAAGTSGTSAASATPAATAAAQAASASPVSTGDTTPILLCIAAFVLSGSVISVLLKKRKSMQA